MNNELPSIEKLKWQCRRGVLELDLIFQEFLEQQYLQLNDQSKHEFVELLRHSDQDLQQWLFHKTSPTDRRLLGIINKITQAQAK